MQKLLSVIEWIIVAAFLFAGISMFFVDPVTSQGPVIDALGSRTAAMIYAVIFLFSGTALAYGKIFNKQRIIKFFLMVAYLVALFVLLLEFLLLGWTWFMLDELALAALAGWTWLQVKIKTEYISYEELEHFDEK